VLADVLFLITLVMDVAALFTTLQWPALFPDLRDYLALAALPIRMRDIFLAKATSLIGATFLVIAGVALLPSVVVPAMMGGRYGSGTRWHAPGIFFASLLGGLFIFFMLVAFQGVLLNLVPNRQFPHISLAMQGVLLAALLGGLPFVLSIPDLYGHIDPLPSWAIYCPPVWFFGIDQMLTGQLDPSIVFLARTAVLGLVGSGVAALSTYFWSYHRHRVRILESSSGKSASRRAMWPDIFSEKLFSNPRSLGVFSFIAKSLARSRPHRLFLIAFGAIALAFISQGFAGVALVRGNFRGMSALTEGVRESVIAIPLAISLCVLAGLRYLFRLPIELRANWLFRILEPGNAAAMLTGVERFLFFWGVLPVALVTLPVETTWLGVRTGGAAALACALISLLLVEFLLFTFEQIPFTSSYLPGRRPLIETALKYSISAVAYVWGFAGLVSVLVRTGASTVIFVLVLGIAWRGLRGARLTGRQIGRLEFEETLEPAVHILGIDRD